MAALKLSLFFLVVCSTMKLFISTSEMVVKYEIKLFELNGTKIGLEQKTYIILQVEFGGREYIKYLLTLVS